MINERDNFCLAPLRGVTGLTFRNVFTRHFGGFDRAMAPFIPTVPATRVKPQLLKELDPQLNTTLPVIPQVLSKDPVQLKVMLKALKELGYKAVDLNLGCPWPMVVKRGRGSGLLQKPDLLVMLLEAGCAELPGGFSIKVRLGIETPDLLLPLVETFNQFPLREITIHPRTAHQMYDGEVSLLHFARCMERCRHTVMYNGDIFTWRDFQNLKQAFPQIQNWMIGRGAVADPFLPQILRDKSTQHDLQRLKTFLDDLLATTQLELSGNHPVLGRMKEFWSYLSRNLKNGKMLLRRIHLCQTIDDYRRVVEDWFSRNPAWGRVEDGLSDRLFTACMGAD